MACDAHSDRRFLHSHSGRPYAMNHVRLRSARDDWSYDGRLRSVDRCCDRHVLPPFLARTREKRGK